MRRLFSMLLVPIAMETRHRFSTNSRSGSKRAFRIPKPCRRKKPKTFWKNHIQHYQLSSDQNPGYLLYIYIYISIKHPHLGLEFLDTLQLKCQRSLVSSTVHARAGRSRWRVCVLSNEEGGGMRVARVRDIEVHTLRSFETLESCLMSVSSCIFHHLIFNPNIWKTLQHLGKFTFLLQFFRPFCPSIKTAETKIPNEPRLSVVLPLLQWIYAARVQEGFCVFAAIFPTKKHPGKNHRHTHTQCEMILRFPFKKLPKRPNFIHCAKFHNPRVLRVRKK